LRKDAEISRKRAISGKKGGLASLGNKRANEDCLSKAGANDEAKPKPQKPEARDQKERKKEEGDGERVADAAAPDGASTAYAFEGAVIKLNEIDMARWRRTYHAIPDLEAELSSIDCWFQGEGAAKATKWFFTAQGALNRKHQEIIGARQEAKAKAWERPIA
jgi:hypothetical protein